ncbi:MAG: hypothetical protein JSS07_08810 [Proteobacteria bacterium]|nr:hypothetical protein [Pseudomonadota bacterium]
MKIPNLIKAKSSNIMMLWSIIFALVGILLFIFAFNGIAIAISFFNKFLFFLSFICLLIAGALFYFKKDIKVKVEK